MAKYIPSVIFAILEVGIVILILTQANYTDNQGVMAGLALLYASIRSVAIGFRVWISNLTLAFANDITTIKEKIGVDFDAEEERRKIQEGNENVKKQDVKLTISGIGVFVIYVVALLYILG